jgi:hypothetical protein
VLNYLVFVGVSAVLKLSPKPNADEMKFEPFEKYDGMAMLILNIREVDPDIVSKDMAPERYFALMEESELRSDRRQHQERSLLLRSRRR